MAVSVAERKCIIPLGSLCVCVGGGGVDGQLAKKDPVSSSLFFFYLSFFFAFDFSLFPSFLLSQIFLKVRKTRR